MGRDRGGGDAVTAPVFTFPRCPECGAKIHRYERDFMSGEHEFLEFRCGGFWRRAPNHRDEWTEVVGGSCGSREEAKSEEEAR